MAAFSQQPADDKLDIVVLDGEPPSSLKDWALFDCPELARRIFRTNSNLHCINKHSIPKQVACCFCVLNSVVGQIIWTPHTACSLAFAAKEWLLQLECEPRSATTIQEWHTFCFPFLSHWQ